MPVVESLRLGAEVVLPGPGPIRGAPAEEVRVVLAWLLRPGTRLVHVTRPWSEPVAGAARWRPWLHRAEAGRAGYAAAD